MGDRVLIVDDDPLSLRLLERYLTAEGHETLRARNGAEALRTARSENVRMVVTDWTMPEVDGPGLCRAIRASEQGNSVYIIMLTAHTDTECLLQAFDAGADDFLSKPFHRQELIARLNAGKRILRLEEELVRQNRIAQERDQLRNAVSALEQVLGIVGHELRTPLASARVMTELLLHDNARETESLEQFLTVIHEQVVTMADTVSDLLDVARLNQGVTHWNWSEVVVEDVCCDALQTITPLVDHAKVSLSLQVTPPDLTMRGDPGAIRRLLVNLLSNAQKHTDAGSIEIRADALTEDHLAWVRLEVRDTGEGMTAATADRLGLPFVLNSGAVGDRYARGSGLGLSICRGIVAAHGGRLHVSSEEGAGTTVRVLLRADLTEPQPIEDPAHIATEVVS